MIIVSDIIDAYIRMRFNSKSYRKEIYSKALNKELRQSKWGTIIIRNFNELMAGQNQYHDEVKEWFQIKDYGKTFWETDFGYLWFFGNEDVDNPYFTCALNAIKKNKYTSHLDIGCGWGRLSTMVYKETGIKSTGIDVSEGVIIEAKRRNVSEGVQYHFVDAMDFDQKADIVTVIGAPDYMDPAKFLGYLKKFMLLANKEVQIMNSLRGVPFEDCIAMRKAIKTFRYDEGYVQPINNLLAELKDELGISYEVKKMGEDSTMTIIKKLI